MYDKLTQLLAGDGCRAAHVTFFDDGNGGEGPLGLLQPLPSLKLLHFTAPEDFTLTRHFLGGYASKLRHMVISLSKDPRGSLCIKDVSNFPVLEYLDMSLDIRATKGLLRLLLKQSPQLQSLVVRGVYPCWTDNTGTLADDHGEPVNAQHLQLRYLGWIGGAVDAQAFVFMMISDLLHQRFEFMLEDTMVSSQLFQHIRRSVVQYEVAYMGITPPGTGTQVWITSKVSCHEDNFNAAMFTINLSLGSVSQT
jgi:hypothetical protein